MMPARFSIKRLFRRYLYPTQLVVLSFTFVIAIGTFLLSLPIATTSRTRMPLIDALFTATSATCVTGLAVVDIGTYFSTFGQLVILACIQIGGLGLMTFTTVFLVVVGKRLAIADTIAIQESFHHTPTGRIRPLIKYIVVATITIEAVGALILTLRWMQQGRYRSLGETVYHAVFHSVSAFCNAGFALQADSLTPFQNDPIVLIVISTLIVLGGLGFLVGLDLKEYAQQTLFQRFWSKRVRTRVEIIRPRPRLSIHSKFVVITTFVLLVVGTVSYYLLERRGLFASMHETQAWLNAYFCAVTPRTAGFNTIDFAQMGGPALLCTMVLMFIGASPGSTGGGIKTSSFAVLVTYAISRWRGQTRLHAFNRTVPQESIDKAAAVVISSTALVILAASALMAIETQGSAPVESRNEFLGILFETISAFGTVGLSMGQTPLLSEAGRLIIILVMLMGRTGPLTLALAISMKQERAEYRFAEENVMVG